MLISVSQVAEKAIAVLAIPTVASVILSILCSLVYNLINDFPLRHGLARVFGQFFIITAPFALVGMVSGFLTGVSRDPAVSALIPAALTFAGGAVAFVMTRSAATTMVASLSIICLSAFVLFGSLLGASERELHDAYQNSLEQQYKRAEVEFAIKAFRQSLGLDDPGGSAPDGQ